MHLDFQTIKSILKSLILLLSVILLTDFQTIKSILKLMNEEIEKGHLENFQTIKSILKSYTYEVGGLCRYCISKLLSLF